MELPLPNFPWPPEYTVKKHRKAKSVKLRTSRKNGLQITIPYRFSVKHLPAILEEHRLWITKQLRGLQLERATLLPETIELAALNQTWHIHYMPCEAALEIITKPGNQLAVIGKIDDKKLCQKKLMTWVKQQAKLFLIAELTRISLMTQLPFAKVSMRDQQTLWGSCTIDKAISLNYKLIFLPQPLVRHILIHELCHTKHLNHSVHFWRLVASFDANWQVNKRDLKKAQGLVPAWFEQ